MRDMHTQAVMEGRRQLALQRAKQIGEAVQPKGYDRFDPDQAARGRLRFRISLLATVALFLGLCWSLGMMLGIW